MNANEEKTRLLVVEDESHLAAGLKLNLQLEGYEVDVAATALHARMTVEEFSHLDLSYTPPFSPVWEPLVVAANVAPQ